MCVCVLIMGQGQETNANVYTDTILSTTILSFIGSEFYDKNTTTQLELCDTSVRSR